MVKGKKKATPSKKRPTPPAGNGTLVQAFKKMRANTTGADEQDAVEVQQPQQQQPQQQQPQRQPLQRQQPQQQPQQQQQQREEELGADENEAEVEEGEEDNDIDDEDQRQEQKKQAHVAAQKRFLKKELDKVVFAMSQKETNALNALGAIEENYTFGQKLMICAQKKVILRAQNIKQVSLVFTL